MIYKINIENVTSIEFFIEDDMTTVRFKDYILFNDSLLECINTLKRMLEKALNDELEIDQGFNGISIGRWWNDYTNSYDEEIDKEDLAEKFWLWSTRYVQSWLFNKNSKIYIEISLSYPWHFVDPLEGEDFISYEEFIDSFEPISIIEISPDQARMIIEECNRLVGCK